MSETHNEQHNEQFDALLRDKLKSMPTLDPIANLPELAIALARSRRPARQIKRVRHERFKHTRLLTISTTFAVFAIACIWVVGAWFMLTNETLFPTSSFASIASINAQINNLGFTIATLAAIAVTLALLATSFLDLIDSRESATQFPVCVQ